MLRLLFPITDNWCWYTFVLYIVVSILVCMLCKKGAELENFHITFNKKKLVVRASTLCYFSAFFLLVLLGTLRSVDVGPDTRVYVGYFENATLGNFDWSKLLSFQQMEPGFQLYLKIIRIITKDYHIFFFITYSLVSFSYIRYIKYFYNAKSDYIFLQLFIFFYVSNMSGMRAALGTVFLLQSFIQISKNKYASAIVTTFIAATFHYTMVFNLIIISLTWLLRKSQLLSKRWLFPLGMFFTAIVSYFAANTFKLVLSSTKYDFYSSVSLEDISILGSFIYILYAIGCFVFYKKIFKFSNRKLENIFIISIVFLITYPALFVTSAYRIPNYYAMPRISIWSEFKSILCNRIKPNNRWFFNVLVQILIILYLLFRFTRSAQDGSFTYIPIWIE